MASAENHFNLFRNAESLLVGQRGGPFYVDGQSLPKNKGSLPVWGCISMWRNLSRTPSRLELTLCNSTPRNNSPVTRYRVQSNPILNLL